MYINESDHKDNDQPVKEALWPRVAEYCDNDVITTEEVLTDWIKNAIKEISIFYEHGFKTPEDILNVIDVIDKLSKVKEN